MGDVGSFSTTCGVFKTESAFIFTSFLEDLVDDVLDGLNMSLEYNVYGPVRIR